MVVIGEILLSAFIQVVFQKLASPEVLTFARREGIHTQLTKLRKTLTIIYAVLNDAEEKETTDRAVKQWLEDLKDLTYDLDDVLDDFATEALRRKLMDRDPNQASTSTVRNLIPTCCTSFTPAAVKFDYDMRSKIKEMNDRLQDIARQKDELSLKDNVGGIRSDRVRERLPTTSLVDKSRVCGRENDKKVILDLLLKRGETSDDGEISVIPIVGMGGVGKTTLAQLVYDDEALNDQFDLKAWACVSDDFNVIEVTRTILEAVSSQKFDFKDLNMLQVKLKETLSRKKYLIVLDDIWNEKRNKWDLLRLPFLDGAPGSKILFTTRNDEVARIMSNVPTYRLKQLSDDDCLSLFAQCSLGRRDFEEHPDLREIGEAIVKKCNGLPLAAKTLGGLLQAELEKKRWEDILNSKIWEIPQERSDILPALRLSYFHLPSHLKRCFAYCSIFPKDYEFDKDELILLWMAEGLLQLKNLMEDFGDQCFRDLLSRSFFQQSSGNKAGFVMHDLMNDLAQFVSGELCFRLVDNFGGHDQFTVSKRTRHLSYTRQEYEVFQKFDSLYEVKCLRTFLSLPVYKVSNWPEYHYLSNRVLLDLLPKLHCLRVLSLSGYKISELPHLICKLKHLRYLNLSCTSIQRLPESLGTLYNLQTLSLRNCKALRTLPSSIINLINLRHLDNANTKLLEELPLGIGKLTNLQTLSKIIVGKSNGSRLTELKHLVHLRGKLSIVKLENVMDVREAMEANLMGMQDVDELELGWSENFDDSRNEKLEMDVLETLKPQRKLKKLKIEFYRGTSFATWMMGNPTFSEMVNLSLSGCTKCESLPPLGQLPLLKDLLIRGMHGVKSIGAEFCKYDCPLESPFPSLESLKFEDMPELEEWCFFNNDMEKVTQQLPCLRVLTMCKCPKLKRISVLSLPSLCELFVDECDEIVLKNVIDLRSLTSLKVKRVRGLCKLPEEVLQFLVALEELEFNECDQLLTPWEREEDTLLPVPFCKLRSLEIRACANLEKLPNVLNNLKSLKRLVVSGCSKLVRFPEKGLPPLLSWLWLRDCEGLRWCPTDTFPTTLKDIDIKNCMELEWVSETMVHDDNSIRSSMSSLEQIYIDNWPNMGRLVGCINHFVNLLSLNIWNCESLECFPERGGLSSIPNLTSLGIGSCVNLRSLPPFHQIQSLTYLFLYGCPNIELFGNNGNLPPKLVSISVDGDYGKPSLSEWGLHKLTSLQTFTIYGGFSKMICFPDNDKEELCVFPANLIQLDIQNLRNVECISSKGLRNLTSLQRLSFRFCPKLGSLPKEGLPFSTLQCLRIEGCPKLEERCKKDRGDHWPIIADIPCVHIDYRYIYE